MGVVEILGGIGLTLFGVRFLRKGLDRLFGGKLVDFLARMTANRWRAFLGGIAAGAVAPSSAGLSLAAAQLLGTGKLSPERMLAVLLGANVGLTITVQLLAFRVEAFAGVFIIMGVLAFQFLTREIFRGLGQCLLSLGFVFLAIGMIGHGANEFTKSPEMVEAFHLLHGHPLIVLVAVAILTVLLQSSTATIGLGLGLTTAGLLTPDILIPWVIGTNLGLGLTSLFAGWTDLESRRMGAGNLAVKLVVAVPLLAFPALAEAWFTMWHGSLLRETAMFHTGFNLVVGLIAMPLLAPISRLTRFLIAPPPNQELAVNHSFLDAHVLETPSLALARATRETLRMADHVRVMLENFWTALLSGNAELSRRIQREDDVVDQINRDLKDYLSRIGEGKSPEDVHWQFTLLTFSNELESIGDLIDKQLCDLLVKQRTDGVTLEFSDQQQLLDAYGKLLGRFESAVGLLTTRSPAEAMTFLAGKEVFNDWFRRIQREHYERLHAASRATLNSSAFFLDYLNGLRRINSHLSTIGYAFYDPSSRDRKSKV